MRLLCVIAMLAFLLSCKEKREEVKPARETITESAYASGIVRSRGQYQAFSTVSGLIRVILVREGDLVRKGDPIMRLVNAEASLRTENARLAAQYASLPANADKLHELRQNIEVAKARKDHDALLLSRQRALWAGGIGTRNELDGRELAYRTSKGAHDAARLRYADIERQLNFQALQARKNQQISETLSGDFTIKSDATGRVYRILKEQGELVHPQTPVALIGDARDFIIELQVDEYDIVKIRRGQKVLLSMESYKGRTFDAVVEQISPAMDPASRAFTVEASFVEAPAVLYPNLTVEANILIRVKEGALTIPRSYLLDSGYVLTAADDRRKVVTGIMDYQKAEILSGLSEGEIILKPAP